MRGAGGTLGKVQRLVYEVCQDRSVDAILVAAEGMAHRDLVICQIPHRSPPSR